MSDARLTPAQRLEQRKQKRLDEILAAAAGLFSRLGYEATTADAIASSVHLTKSALYTYVGSKEEMAVRLLQSVVEQLLERAQEIDRESRSGEQRLRALIVAHVTLLGHHPASSLLFWHSEHVVSADRYPELYAARDRYEQYVRDWIEEGVRDGVFRVRDAQVAGFMLLGSLNWVIRWYAPGGRLSSEAIGDEYAAMLIGALKHPEPGPGESR